MCVLFGILYECVSMSSVRLCCRVYWCWVLLHCDLSWGGRYLAMSWLCLHLDVCLYNCLCLLMYQWHCLKLALRWWALCFEMNEKSVSLCQMELGIGNQTQLSYIVLFMCSHAYLCVHIWKKNGSRFVLIDYSNL